jgi:hypothetical protein
VAKPEAVLLTAERSPIASRRSVDYPHRCVQEAEGGTQELADRAELYEKIGRLDMEVEWLRKSVARYG